MRKLFKFIFVFVVLFLSVSSYSQLSNTLYFNDYNPRQHWLNPSFRPEGKFYVGMPALSTIAVGGGNSRLTFEDIFQNVTVNGEKKTVLFFDKNADSEGYENFLKKMKYNERIFASYRLHLLEFGFRIKEKGYATFGLSNRLESMVVLPNEVFGLVFEGMENEPYDWNLDKLSTDATLFTELALGYSHRINDKLEVGGKFKYLYGHANLHTKLNDVTVTSGPDEWVVKGDASIHAAMPGLTVRSTDEGRIDGVDMDVDPVLMAKPQGHGIAFDLGATYRPLPELKVSASVIDLGFIRWKNNLSQVDKVGDFAFEGISYDINDDTTDYFDPYEEMLEEMFENNENPSAYTTGLKAQIHLAAEWAFWENRIGLGILSKTYIYHRNAWEEFLLTANFRPFKQISLSLGYGMFDGEWNNLSAGINFNLGPVNLFVLADNIPFRYAKSGDATFPSNTRHARVNTGLAFVIGDRFKDKDKDGVEDKLDLCPNTLKGVQVDSKGCPLDSDKDGVADYLDKCANTPKEAIGKVDSVGCPLDSDKDGVADYLDQCANTPKEAIGKIDSVGCPLDSDGDGVADYLDKCANTPKEAIGKTDSVGCPLDSDGDGIYDYEDKCPNLAGVKDNSGCPEVKAEVKQLFKKALNGIQFASGKATIMKRSYPILNDVVKVMEENPTYNLSIVGHTDSSGDPEKNLKLSQDRAASVKDYLIMKGVDASRIRTDGKGDTEPVADNATVQGRTLNRRVAFEIEYME